jgi:hypothetical protein
MLPRYGAATAMSAFGTAEKLSVTEFANVAAFTDPLNPANVGADSSSISRTVAMQVPIQDPTGVAAPIAIQLEILEWAGSHDLAAFHPDIPYPKMFELVNAILRQNLITIKQTFAYLEQSTAGDTWDKQRRALQTYYATGAKISYTDVYLAFVSAKQRGDMMAIYVKGWLYIAAAEAYERRGAADGRIKSDAAMTAQFTACRSETPDAGQAAILALAGQAGGGQAAISAGEREGVGYKHWKGMNERETNGTALCMGSVEAGKVESFMLQLIGSPFGAFQFQVEDGQGNHISWAGLHDMTGGDEDGFNNVCVDSTKLVNDAPFGAWGAYVGPPGLPGGDAYGGTANPIAYYVNLGVPPTANDMRQALVSIAKSRSEYQDYVQGYDYLTTMFPHTRAEPDPQRAEFAVVGGTGRLQSYVLPSPRGSGQMNWKLRNFATNDGARPHSFRDLEKRTVPDLMRAALMNSYLMGGACDLADIEHGITPAFAQQWLLQGVVGQGAVGQQVRSAIHYEGVKEESPYEMTVRMMLVVMTGASVPFELRFNGRYIRSSMVGGPLGTTHAGVDGHHSSVLNTVVARLAVALPMQFPVPLAGDKADPVKMVGLLQRVQGGACEVILWQAQEHSRKILSNVTSSGRVLSALLIAHIHPQALIVEEHALAGHAWTRRANQVDVPYDPQGFWTGCIAKVDLGTDHKLRYMMPVAVLPQVFSDFFTAGAPRCVVINMGRQSEGAIVGAGGYVLPPVPMPGSKMEDQDEPSAKRAKRDQLDQEGAIKALQAELEALRASKSKAEETAQELQAKVSAIEVQKADADIQIKILNAEQVATEAKRLGQVVALETDAQEGQVKPKGGTDGAAGEA